MQTAPTAKSGRKDRLREALRTVRSSFWAAGGLSLAINILMLTGPLFMLQVYDRVLASGSVPTLVALFLLVVALYMFMGVFDFLRTRVLSRIGYAVDQRLGVFTLRNHIIQTLTTRPRGGRPLTDLASLRAFLGGGALPALFDLPWAPIYLAIVFALHFQLGLLALGGAVVVLIIALLNEALTKEPAAQSARFEQFESQVVDDSQRTAEAIVAMGMTGHVVGHWSKLRNKAAYFAQQAAERGEGLAATSKAFRMLLQSAILALGAYLAIHGEITAGTIVAASILAGRALAPIDQTIGNWRNIIKARQAYARLSAHLMTAEDPPQHVALPRPVGRINVDRLVKYAPTDRGAEGTRRTILHGVSIDLQPGDGLGVIGPSASGKSTLARLLVGLWTPDQGVIRIDGATHEQWDIDALGRHVGYLPQSVELISGTIRQNISRFDPDALDEEVITAAQIAGVHDIVLKLSDGYTTDIGHGRTPLSGGQAQRIALARAIFRAPPLIVLDEPSSNLDHDGDAALTAAIEMLRAKGSTVIVMTHRPSAIAAVNKILMLKDGRQTDFGEKSDVLRRVTKVA